MKNKKQIFLLVTTLILPFAFQVFFAIQTIGQQGDPPPSKSPNAKPSHASSKPSVQKSPSPKPTPASARETQQDLGEVREDLKALEGRIKQLEKNSNPVASAETTEKSDEGFLPDWLKWALIGLAGLSVLGGIVTGGFFLRRNNQRERSETTRGFGDLRKRHAELSKEVKDLKEATKNLSQQLAQSKVEIARMKDASQNVSSYAAAPASMTPTISSYQTPKEESLFPVSVDDFLAKSKSGAIPVKYDYKERMLVEDDAREGGLLVVRDGSDRLLYLVPSFGFFQTKSDYTNYFERYYACARPASGNVWIRQPATVAQVSGGWKLANQGELEVR